MSKKWGHGINCTLCTEDFQNINGLLWHYINLHGVKPIEPKVAQELERGK